MLELRWLDEDNNSEFTEADKETAEVDGDTRRCAAGDCKNWVGWYTEWAMNVRSGQDYPYAAWAECALVLEGVVCHDCGQAMIDNGFAQEVV